MPQFHQVLHDIRLAKRITLRQAIMRVGLESVVYSQIERARLIPTEEQLDKICVGLAFTPGESEELRSLHKCASVLPPKDIIPTFICGSRKLTEGEFQNLIEVLKNS